MQYLNNPIGEKIGVSSGYIYTNIFTKFHWSLYFEISDKNLLEIKVEYFPPINLIDLKFKYRRQLNVYFNTCEV